MRDATRCPPHTPCAASEPAHGVCGGHSTDSALALLALRYAAGELDPAETELFESRLGVDQAARDALAEAVRLSAAASGLPTPAPDPLVREAAREKLQPTWATRLFPRRPYRGHPLAWAGGGGLAAAVVAVVLPVLTAEPPAVVTLLPADQTSQLAFTTALTDQPPIDEGTGNALATESSPPLNATDPLVNPKLNPMRYEERSPLTGRMLPQLPSEPATGVTVPSTPVPTSGPRAEVPTEQEAAQPMGTIEGTTKKG